MSKNCANCPYYLSRSKFCALLGRKIKDPSNPPCEAPKKEKTKPSAKVVNAKPASLQSTVADPVPRSGGSISRKPNPKVAVVPSAASATLEAELEVELPPSAFGDFDYVPTGIDKLDEVLGGGFIRGKTYLVAGETGAGKTIFSIQFLLTGAIKYGEPGIYVAIDEPTDQLIKGLRRFGWDVEPLIKEGLLKFLDMRTHFSKIYLRDERRKIEPRYIIESILNIAKKSKAKRLVIDPIAPLIYGGTPDDILYVREFLREMVFAIERVGTLTTVMTSEIPTGSKKLSRFGVEEFLASGIIVLGLEEVGGEVVRVMYVRKARWAPAKPMKLVFDIESGKGIVIRGFYKDFV